MYVGGIGEKGKSRLVYGLGGRGVGVGEMGKSGLMWGYGEFVGFT